MSIQLNLNVKSSNKKISLPTIESLGMSSVIHDGVKHWQGAAKDSWFEHIAITAGRQA